MEVAFEHQLLADQVSNILKRLNGVELVPLAASFHVFPLEVSAFDVPISCLNMAVDTPLPSSNSSHLVFDGAVAELGPSSSKILTSKVGGLESKLSALEASVGFVLAKLDLLCSGSGSVLVWKFAMCNVWSINVPAKQADIVCWHVSSGNIGEYNGVCIFISGLEIGFLGTGVVIIMNNSLVCHVSKIEEVLGQIIVMQLLFKNKLSVSVASVVNSLIAKAANSSTFVILGGNFNENGSGRSASFKFCSSLGLVNLFTGHPLVGASTWGNSRRVKKTIDFIFVSENLASAVASHGVSSVLGFFNTDHSAVMVSIRLGGLLDVHLNSLHKHANKDCWKFNIKDMDETKWSHFRDCSSTAVLDVMDSFHATAADCDLDVMWSLLEKVLMDSANSILDADKAFVLVDMIDSGQGRADVLKFLLVIRREYRKSKMYESKLVQETVIRKAIENYMEKFCSDKSSIIRSVLGQPFQKIVLDHLVVDNELVLEPEEVKLKIDRIMEGWIRKQIVSLVLPDLWDMHKVYDSVGWHHLRASLRHIKMCDRFVEFFGGIHKNRVNRVMTDFGLLNSYRIHDGLDQDEVFSSLLWHIFYDPLLCEIKRHEHLCGYHIDTKFVAKTGRIKNSGGMSSFFAAGAFVNDTIWVGDCQSSMQYALNISVRFAFLSISGQPISIAKKGEAYRYLGIFLSTKGLSKSSLAKTHLDVCFFVYTVLRKAITDKQFSYLVLAILQPIVSYQTQFSFVLSGVCHKWDILIKKGFKSKAHLPHDFSNAALLHPFLYGLKSFKQVQSEAKVAFLIFFSNAPDILGHLFEHRCLDLQIQGWASLNLLQAPVKLHISLVNNFLAGVVKIFLDNDLSLVNNLPNAFHHPGHFPMSLILGKSLYFDSFVAAFKYLLNKSFFFSGSSGTAYSCGLNILKSDVFSSVRDSLLGVWSGCFEVYMDGSLMGAGSADVLSGATAYFSALDLSIGAVTLTLECVPFSCSMLLFLNSQATIDACVSELLSKILDFYNCCWTKIRGHAGNLGNVKADRFADKAAGFSYVLLVRVCEHFLVAKDTMVSGNAHYFVRDLFRSVCHVRWEAGLGHDVVSVDMLGDFDWVVSVRVWHPDSHMLAEFTSQKLADLHMYLIKTLHRRLPVEVKKRLYDKCYLGVQCLLCGEVELPDHVFSCLQDAHTHKEILLEASTHWVSLVLNFCLLDVGRYSVLCKKFVMKSWCAEAAGVFDDIKKASCIVIDFVRFLVELHHSRVWLVRSKFRSDMKRAGLVGNNSLVLGLLCDMSFVLSDSVVKLFGITESFAISFGHCRPCLFFSGLNGSSCVYVSV
ncbi:hypothetical protein G9A89_013486 [Geosiphon pyriformis]|nr:hypothetical protein G9A89_013486 [Geosiphon pyriformis]